METNIKFFVVMKPGAKQVELSVEAGASLSKTPEGFKPAIVKYDEHPFSLPEIAKAFRKR